MPPEAITLRSSNCRSMSGIMIGWPHFVQGWEASGGRSPEMNTLVSQVPQVTIFKGALMLSNHSINYSRNKFRDNTAGPVLECGEFTPLVIIFTRPVKAENALRVARS